MRSSWITFFLVLTLITQLAAQMSKERLEDIVDIKVERFGEILDLTTGQRNQLRNETVKFLQAQSIVSTNKDMMTLIEQNRNNYYKALTLLDKQQLTSLKLIDRLERESRRESYIDIMKVFNQSSEFGIAVATYNWNIAMPILVSHRKDLDQHISAEDLEILKDFSRVIID